MKYFLLLLTLLSTSTFGASSALNFGSLGIGATQLVNATNWVACTPTFSSGFGAVTNLSVWCRQVGDSIEMKGSFTTGSVTNTVGYMQLPNSYVIDSTKMTTSSSVESVGTWYSGAASATGTNVQGGAVFYDGSTTNQLFFANSSSGTFSKSNVSTGIVGNTLFMSFQGVKFPVVGLTAAGGARIAPTQQVFTSGSGTYTLPTSPQPLYIRVEMVGGGGGGAGVGSGQTVGGTGVTSTFGTSLLSAGGGVGGRTPGTPGTAYTGGAVSLGTGPIGVSLVGAPGSSGWTGGTSFQQNGGFAGGSPLGSGGPGAYYATGSGTSGACNPTGYGAGGGGAGGDIAGDGSGGGGQGGGYVNATISSPASTYAYTVGAAGTGGTGASSGCAGSAGYIKVTEYYQ